MVLGLGSASFGVHNFLLTQGPLGVPLHGTHACCESALFLSYTAKTVSGSAGSSTEPRLPWLCHVQKETAGEALLLFISCRPCVNDGVWRGGRGGELGTSPPHAWRSPPQGWTRDPEQGSSRGQWSQCPAHVTVLAMGITVARGEPLALVPCACLGIREQSGRSLSGPQVLWG